MKKCIFRNALVVMIGAGLLLASVSLVQSQERPPRSGGERGIIVVDGTVGSEKQAPSQAMGKGSKPSGRVSGLGWDEGLRDSSGEKGIGGKAGSGPLERPGAGSIEPGEIFRPESGNLR